MQAIAKGDRGNEVVDIQVKLATLGYNLGRDGADGSFGEATEQAVKQFQSARNLCSTGVVDETTWRALVEASYELGDRLLYLRSPYFRGDDVRELQLSLNTLGFNTGKVDGVYGETTERAVREFQRNFGLICDGIFGPSSLDAIRNLRHLLADAVSRIFPDPDRDQHSAISIFREKKIAVDLGMLDYVQTDVAIAEEDEIAQDLGMRLGNLLELLGASVSYIHENGADDLDHGVEIYVGFTLNPEAGARLDTSAILYRTSGGPIADRSRRLADFIREELVRSLGSRDLGVEPSDFLLRIQTDVPAAIIKLLFAGQPTKKSLLDEEVNRQKIAVAVFDGIQNYLQIL